MIEIALKSTLIFAVAAAVNVLLRRGSAAQRHAIWMLAFGSIPVVMVLPRFAITPVPVLHLQATEAIAGVFASSTTSLNFVTPIWISGTAILLLRLALSFVWLNRNRENVTSPLTFGVIQPDIIIPKSAVNWLPALRASVMLHEQAHIGRRDTLAQLFTQIVCAVIWFQPLAWYAAARADEEREHACDDLVVSAGVEPGDYANHLIEIARESSHYTAALAMARRSSLEERLRSILNRSTSRATVTARYRTVLVIAGLVAALAVSALGADERVYKADDPGLTAPKLIHKVDVRYTEEAREAGIQGEVTVSLEINTDGNTQNIRVVEGLNPDLDRNAIAAVKEWRFKPATKDGKPVTCVASVKIGFRIK